QLAQQAQCPVLTVTEDFDSGHLQNIVVPVDDFLPIRKLSFATYLAKKANAVIHLMSSGDRSNEEDIKRTRCLTKAYQLLKEYSHVKVYCTAHSGNSIAEDTLTYAKNVNADLIVVNPGRESVMKGWFSRWMKNYLYRKSNIPVLTIAPQS
ncbi:MAG TPA: universal stress protein, partial [Chitinophagaceae bacterium]